MSNVRRECAEYNGVVELPDRKKDWNNEGVDAPDKRADKRKQGDDDADLEDKRQNGEGIQQIA